MKMTENEAAELYRQMTARGGQRGAECLDDDLLLLTSSNDLRPGDRVRIAAHIAQCSDCARAYRVARAMRPFRADARAALGWPKRQWWAAAAAADVTIAVATYAWQTAGTIGDLRQSVSRQQQELMNARRALAVQRARIPQSTPRQPQIGVPIVDLDPEPARGSAAPATTVDVPRGIDQFTLVLHLPEAIHAPAEIEIDDGKGPVWRGTIGAGIESGMITLVVPRGLIHAGSYNVRVRSGQRQTTFPFRANYR
jgi:hypothetical protein